MRTRIRAALLGAATIGMVVGGSAGAEAADIDGTDARIDYSEPCAGAYHDWIGEFVFGTVVNNCAYRSIHVKIDWAWTTDGDCTWVGPRRSYTEARHKYASIRDVKPC